MYLHILHSLVNIDITRLFNNILLQQTQPQDLNGEETITALYTRWYLEIMLRRVASCQILFAPHLYSFVNNANAEPVPFNAEEYTDTNGICLIIYKMIDKCVDFDATKCS